jgi:eukaryotic-like serine/threonine-protein kinase
MRSRPDTDRLRQLSALLETALALAPAQRSEWLAALPSQQQPLAPELRELLNRAEVETDDFMRHSAHELLQAQHLVEDHAGDVVGPYRLVAELGQGGMSTVWRAQRCDGQMQREVALKLPHAGWAFGIVQRMARERDILASLVHPCIARLYDAGITDQGRPWLAMERVEGQPIDEYCREQHLDVAARLQLFLQVAEPVSHAHAQLVVHRDLKPSNILVTPDGEVRLLDFGVAKLIKQDVPPEQQLTRQIGRAVTPDYAAPEQLGGRSVGTAADTYSLGVVLFELLTGQRPYQLGPLPCEDALLEIEVPRPSACVADAALRRALRGDLDTIIGMAMRKQPGERYPSVEAFAADVRRHLAGKPVLAQAPHWRYRAGKFLQRNRLPVAAGTFAAMSLVFGMGVAIWQAHTAREEALRAERAKTFVSSILRQAQPRKGVGGAVLASELLVAAGERIERELAADPRAAAELGIVIGERLSSLGDPQRGEPALRAAVARSTALYGLRHSLTVRGRALWAESLSVPQPELAERVADALVPDALAGLPATAADAVFALRTQALHRARRNEARLAYQSLRQAVVLAERHLGREHEETVYTLGLLSSLHGRFVEYGEQLVVASQARQRAQAVMVAKRPNLLLTAVERWYAEALRNNDRPAEAVPILRAVIEDQRELDGTDTERVRNAIFQLGAALSETGELDEGIARLREAIAMEARQNTADNDDRFHYQVMLAEALGFARFAAESRALTDELHMAPKELSAQSTAWEVLRFLRYAQMQALLGEPAAAERMAAQARLLSGDVRDPSRAAAWTISAMNMRYQRDRIQALDLAQRAWNDPGRDQLWTSLQAVIAAELASAWLDVDADRAAAWTHLALALFDKSQVKPSPRSAAAWVAHARLLLRDGRADEALRVLDPVIASWRAVNPRSEWHGEALHWSAVALTQLGRGDEAHRRRAQAQALLRRSPLPLLRALASSAL